MKKRLLSIVFALLMLCQLLSFSILASDVVPDENEIPAFGWGNVYKVTLPEAPVGYTITGDASVNEGEDYTFTVTILEGYEKGDAFAVLANGVDVTSTGVDDVYTIENITADQIITVTGVEEEEPAGIPGDINGDGKVSAADVRTLKRYRADYEGLEYDEKALDINGDGKVSAADVRTLKRYRADYEGLELYYNGVLIKTT